MRSLFRVDTVPWALRAPFWVYSEGALALFKGYRALLRATSTIEVIDGGGLARAGNAIYCHWHGGAWIMFAASSAFEREVWIGNPQWYVKPMHLFVESMGAERILLGSTGQDGRRAADELVSYLRRGYSTHLTPDGPSGPPGEARKGAVHISEQAGVAIVPITLSCDRFVRLPSWDGKILPLPFSKLVIRYGAPLPPDATRGVDDRVKELESALSRAVS